MLWKILESNNYSWRFSSPWTNAHNNNKADSVKDRLTESFFSSIYSVPYFLIAFLIVLVI